MKKTILFNVLTLAAMLLTAYSTMVDGTTLAIFGSISALITLLLNSQFPSGTWIGSEWKFSQYAVSISQVILSWLAVSSTVELIPEIPVDIVNFITIGATVAIQFFGRAYKEVK
jgi:hypothetical protein